MASNQTFHNIAVIRELLLAAFVPEALRRLCQDEPSLRPVLNRFSPKHGLDDMAGDLVDYCHDNQLWEELLAAVRRANPNQYARFEPRLYEPVSAAQLVSHPLLDACRAQVESVLAGLRHKYDPTLYVNRAIEGEIDAFFDAPLTGPVPNCFLIVAPAGSGKTNLLCDLARRRVARQPVVLLMGGSLYLSGETGLLGAVQTEIEAAGPEVQFHSAAGCLHSLGRLAEELNRDALLILDAINEHDSPDEMKKALGSLLRATRGKRVKLLVTCRDYYWGLFQADFWPAALANRPPAEPAAEEKGPAEEDFSRFGAAEQERALALYLDHYQIIGHPVGDAAEQCRQPLLLRFFCEAYRGQEVGEMEDIRLKELFDEYWKRKLSSIAELMAKQRPRDGAWLAPAELAAAVGDYLLTVAAYMLHHNVRAAPLAEIGQAGGREEQPGDRRSYYGRIRDEFIILEEVERGEGRQRACQVAFVYEEFMEYAMARSLIRDWERANLDERAILAAIEALTGKYGSFAQILGVIVYLGLMLKEQRGLALWSLLLNKGEQWRGVVFETFRKLPKDQLDAGVFDALLEMLNSDQEESRLQVLDTLKIKRVGQAAPTALLAVVVRLAQGDNRPLARRAALALGYAPPDLAVPVLCRLVQDADKRSVRENAVTSLGRLDDARAVKPLIAALKDSNWEVRRNAVAALGKLGDAAVMPLIAALGSSNRKMRRHAAEAPDRLGHGRAVESLIAALKDSNGEARRRAAEALGKLGDKRAAMPLIAALEDSDEGVRRCAAEALEKLGGGRAAKRLIAALGDGNEQVRRLVALQLRDIWSGAEPSLPSNIDRLARRGAAEALAILGDTRAVKPFIAALADDDEEVQWIAAEALGKLGDTRAVEPLIAALEESEKEVREIAAQAMGKLGNTRAVEPLIAAFGDSYGSMRRSAAEALGKLGDGRAVEPLIAALGDGNDEVRRAAAEALGEMGDSRAVEPLVAALSDNDSLVRKIAALALRRIGTPEALAALRS